MVRDVIIGTDIMNAYEFGVDLRENVPRVGQEKKKFCTAKMIRLYCKIKQTWNRAQVVPVSYTHLDVYKRQAYSPEL